jgi:hypothetical protein
MRTVLFGVLSAAVAFSIPARPHAQAVAPASTAFLAGRVVTGAGADARPLRRAKITLTGAGLSAPVVVDTDTSGAYQFVRVPPGSLKLRAQKPGFITLEADAAPNATLTLTRGGALEGGVTDRAGEPVWNVVVSALQMDNGRPRTIAQARTDDLGHYRIHSLRAGDYFVQVATDRSFIFTLPLLGEEKWIDRSRFVTMARPTQQGRFVSQPLPPDDYLAIALPGVTPLEIYDPDFLQSLRALATSFTLTEGETKTLELKLRRRP